MSPDGFVYANYGYAILKYWYAGTMVRASDPSLELFVDGERYLGSMVFRWEAGSVHEIVTTPVQNPAAGTRFDFVAWEHGGGISQNVVISQPPPTFTANFDKSYWLDAQTEHGTVDPASGWKPEGSLLYLHAIPNEHYGLSEWLGQGDGSYTGRAEVATVRMNGPIVEQAVLRLRGFDFSISASDTDPFATSASPSGGVRNLYLWLTCGDRGLSAFEADVAGSLVPLAFVPQPNVLNVYGADRLMLAVGGCPSGTEANHLLGHWIVQDNGGDLRLVPSASSGAITAVDCHMTVPEPWVDPRVFCFSSNGTPAIVGTNGCPVSGAPAQITNLRAALGLRKVILTWEAIGGAPDGFHVERRDADSEAFVRLTNEALRSDPPSRYEDAAVEEEHAYEYRVIVVQDGEESAFGPVSVTTGNWPRFETRLEPIGPNPAVGRATIAFSLAEPMHAKLAIYDVTGPTGGDRRGRNAGCRHASPELGRRRFRRPAHSGGRVLRAARSEGLQRDAEDSLPSGSVVRRRGGCALRIIVRFSIACRSIPNSSPFSSARSRTRTWSKTATRSSRPIPRRAGATASRTEFP